MSYKSIETVAWDVRNEDTIDFDGLKQLTLLWSDFNGEQIQAPTLLLRVENAQSQVVLARESTREIIGFAIGNALYTPLRRSPIFELWALYVHKDKRRNGIGRRLIEHVTALASSLGCSDVQVSADIREDAQYFYKSLSFKIFATRMRKEI